MAVPAIGVPVTWPGRVTSCCKLVERRTDASGEMAVPAIGVPVTWPGRVTSCCKLVERSR